MNVRNWAHCALVVLACFAAAGCGTGPAVHIQILKASGDGAAQQVPVGTPFATGDRMSVVIRAKSAGELYILSRGTSGSVAMLYPRPEGGQTSHVEARKEILLPGNGGSFRFQGRPGTEFLDIVLAKSPVAELMVKESALSQALDAVRQRALAKGAKVSAESRDAGLVLTVRGSDILFYEIPIQHDDRR